MSGKVGKSVSEWIDPDDAPPWPDEVFDRAEFAIGGTVIRPATGTLTKPGRPRSAAPKQQVSIRLDPDVLEGLRALGQGWQGRMNEALREWLAKR